MTIEISEYYYWLMRYINGDGKYYQLLNFLLKSPFEYILPMDENRFNDGLNLRRDFMRHEYPGVDVEIEGLPHNCSMLEMMIALANRMETDILYDNDYGDRTGEWFWNMINSLGLQDEVDGKFDLAYRQSVIYRFNYRKYNRDGNGSLFYIYRTTKDMRKMEIWMQMHRYLQATMG